MRSLIERFNEPLPLWLFEEKQKFFSQIWQSPLMQACKRGEPEAMETLMIRYWPFVDKFPEIIRKHQLRIFAREFLRHPVDVLFLLNNITKILGEIKGDEANHRSLWTDTSYALGLTLEDLYLGEDFYGAPEPEIYDIIKKVGESVSIFGNKGCSSSTALLRLSAVEIVAEGISLYVRNEFKKISNSAAKWFEVHMFHKDGVMSHEELVYRMAFALDEKRPEREEVKEVIGEVVDLFIKAGEVPF